jgi:hypothetical protein
MEKEKERVSQNYIREIMSKCYPSSPLLEGIYLIKKREY